MKEKNPTFAFGEVSKTLGQMWRDLGDEEKSNWEQKELSRPEVSATEDGKTREDGETKEEPQTEESKNKLDEKVGNCAGKVNEHEQEEQKTVEETDEIQLGSTSKQEIAQEQMAEEAKDKYDDEMQVVPTAEEANGQEDMKTNMSTPTAIMSSYSTPCKNN